MSTSLVPKPQVLPISAEFDQEKVDLIKRTVAAGASNDELALFLHQCRKTGLDPLARQIYFVKRQGKGTIQTGIDGYRLVADRTGAYAGNDDPEFDDAEGLPKWARVTVWKMVVGQRCPFTATARWTQYYPGDQQGWAWKKMPHLMLGKCAEALALRKAFPAELSGVYTTEEMAQANMLPPEGKTEAEAVRDYEKQHMGVIAKAEGYTAIEGTVEKVKESKGLYWFDLNGLTVCGNPAQFPEVSTITMGDEVQFYGVKATAGKKEYYELRELGVILKPSAPKIEATNEDVPF